MQLCACGPRFADYGKGMGINMLKLVLYEIKKLFFKKSVFLTLVIFSIINIIKIFSVYENESLFADKSTEKWSGIYWKLYNDYSGEITLDKVNDLLEIYRPLKKQTAELTASTAQDNPDTLTGNVYSDYYLLSWLYVNPMEYFYMYQSEAAAIQRNAYENMSFYRNVGNDYEYRRNEIIKNIFSKRNIPEFAYTEMYQYYIYYDFSLLLILFISLYGIINVFVIEKETEMNHILLTTVCGGNKTITAKLLSTFIYILSVTFWFLFLDFICFGIAFHSFEGGSMPVYAIQSFAGSSVSVTLNQYSILSGCYKFAGILFFSTLFLLVSSFFKNALLPFIINLLLVFLFILIGENSMGSGYILSKIMNPFMLLINRELFSKTEFINIFGQPVSSYLAAFIFSIGLCILLVISIYLFSETNTTKAIT